MKKGISIIMLLTANLTFASEECIILDSLKSLIPENCENVFNFGRGRKFNDDSSYVFILPIVPHFSSESLLYCRKNKNRLFPVLVNALNDDDFDWSACLILYYLTGEDGSHLYKCNKNCELWRTEYKDKEIEFWQNYLVQWEIRHSSSPTEE